MSPARSHTLDALRSVAMVWMTLYHLCFDLHWMGWLHLAMLDDLFWIVQRSAILCLFLFCAGFGQAMAWHASAGHTRGAYGSRFWQRWLQVAACAACVSLGSWWLFGERFIYFGVLHGLACMLLLARPLAACPDKVLWALGLVCVALGASAPGLHALWPQLGFLNSAPLSILGLISVKPGTEDYVPLLPWLGVLLWGLASGQWIVRHRPQWLHHDTRGWRLLAAPGRWSLSYYMLHQPLLMGLLLLVQTLLSPAHAL